MRPQCSILMTDDELASCLRAMQICIDLQGALAIGLSGVLDVHSDGGAECSTAVGANALTAGKASNAPPLIPAHPHFICSTLALQPHSHHACMPLMGLNRCWQAHRPSELHALKPLGSAAAGPWAGRRSYSSGHGQRKVLHVALFQPDHKAATEVKSLAALSPLEDAVVTHPDAGVSLAVKQLTYEVQIVYEAKGRVLETAPRIWAHVGHSGWKDTCDVELQQQEQQGVWLGRYKVPAVKLPVVTHLEVQLAFKGAWQDGHIVWDNNKNRNWSSSVELAAGEGLVTGNAATQDKVAISCLLLRLDHLASKKLLNGEQVAMLRTLAWSKDFALLKTYQEASSRPDQDLANALKARCSFLRRPGLHVVHIACEMAPIAKVGGLADVVTSLARAHQMTGNLVEVILPKYDCINYSAVVDLRTMTEIQVPWEDGFIRTLVWSGVAEGLPVYFLEPHSKHNLFWRKTIYGCADDVTRFLFFSRAALELLAWTGKRPDVLHVHDWQTAAVSPMLKELYWGTSLGRTGSVLTLHNMAFQGLESPALLDAAGFDRASVYTPDRLRDDTRKNALGEHDINVLKGGVVYADKVTTVSPRYAHEVLRTHLGCGLQGVLNKAAQEGRFAGILNGIDPEIWDPRVDTHIAAQYSAEDCVQGKLACKQALLKELGLPWSGDVHPAGRPVLAVVSRLTEQKGLPLILHGIQVALDKGAQVVVLGSAPDPETHKQFISMQQQFAAGDQARIVLRFDEGLSHRMYAGADCILIPSAFEPCGLTQLISLRYGTVPVVRETGGLADTVHDVFHSAQPEHMRNGYVFQGSDKASVELAVSRAIDAYTSSWEWWSGTLIPRIMRQDWSWSRSGQDYLNLYHALAKAYV